MPGKFLSTDQIERGCELSFDNNILDVCKGQGLCWGSVTSRNVDESGFKLLSKYAGHRASLHKTQGRHRDRADKRRDAKSFLNHGRRNTSKRHRFRERSRIETKHESQKERELQDEIESTMTGIAQEYHGYRKRKPLER